MNKFRFHILGLPHTVTNIELGRQSYKQFDDKFGQYLQDNSSRFN